MAKVVSLGIHILDILGRHVSRFPPGQDLDLIDEIRLTVAGTAAGTSVDLAKLGATVFAMGAVGQDESGRFVVDTMKRYGINTSGIVLVRRALLCGGVVVAFVGFGIEQGHECAQVATAHFHATFQLNHFVDGDDTRAIQRCFAWVEHDTVCVEGSTFAGARKQGGVFVQLVVTTE